MFWFFLKHIFSTHSLLKWSTILLAPSLIYNSCQLLFSIINSSLFPTQHTDVHAFLHQTIKFPWWSTMSRNSTIMLTHYAWLPNPLFDAIKFISTGNRSLLVFFFFLFFFKKFWIQKSVSIDCWGFFFSRNTSSNLITTFCCEYPC